MEECSIISKTAKRRIVPTIIYEDPNAKQSSPASSTLVIAVPRHNEIPNFEMHQTNSRKRKDRPTSDLETQQNVKRGKGKSGVFNRPESLEPFFFFLSHPPSHWAFGYEELNNYLEKKINNLELTPEERQNGFQFREEGNRNLFESCPSKDKWLEIMKFVNDVDADIERIWSKFTMVDKLLNLFGEDSWSEQNLGFVPLQKYTWWISQAQPWFSMFKVASSEEYLQASSSALILELFYRFIWARYTKKVWKQVQSLSSNQGQDSLNMEGREEQQESDSDEVVNASELGESESDSASVYDSDNDSMLDDNEDGVSGEEGKDVEMADQENSSDEDSTSDDHQMDVCEDELIYVRPVDNMNEQNPTEEPSTNGQDVATDSSFMEEDQEELTIPTACPLFFLHAGITSTIESIEIAYWESNQTPPLSSSSGVTSSASNVKTICTDHDNDERDEFGGVWDCRPAFDELIAMTEKRAFELGIAIIPHNKLIAHLDYIYTSIFVPFLKNVGIELIPTDKDGNPILATGQVSKHSEQSSNINNSKVWRLNPTFGLYYFDNILTNSFSNLTNGGIVAAPQFIALFPQLMLHSDAKAALAQSSVYQNVYNKLKTKGKMTAEVEDLVTTLDSLLGERHSTMRLIRTQVINSHNQKIAKKSTIEEPLDGIIPILDIEDDQEDCAEVPEDEDPSKYASLWNPSPMELMLHEHRLDRIKQIDKMLTVVRKQFHALTGEIDLIPAKRKRRTKIEMEFAKMSHPTAFVQISRPEDIDWGDDELNQ